MSLDGIEQYSVCLPEPQEKMSFKSNSLFFFLILNMKIIHFNCVLLLWMVEIRENLNFHFGQRKVSVVLPAGVHRAW